MPAHIEPLRGFVVAPQIGSGQIDILLYDNRKPVLFRNGDLVDLGVLKRCILSTVVCHVGAPGEDIAMAFCTYFRLIEEP